MSEPAATGGGGVRERATRSFRALLEELARHVTADLSVRMWEGTEIPMGGVDPARGAAVTLVVRDPAAIASIVRSPALTTLFEMAARGLIEAEGMSPLEASRVLDHIEVVDFVRSIGAAGLVRRLWPFLLVSRRPTGALAFDGTGEAEEVRHHYDVSNAFYRLFLDERMVYSCAWFEREDASLDEAQRAKLDMCCRKLRLRPGQRLLDIGCGWGALALHAAEHYGVEVVGITLAERQLELARERVAAAGLEHRISIELSDWRDVEGSEHFDAVVQVGMYEHVHAGDQTAFLATVHRLLKADGRYLHHAITTRPDRRSGRPGPYMKVVNRYIFPGGTLDHIGKTLEAMERARFEVHDVEGWRRHYARTCAEWSERLWARREEAEAEVGADVTRTWLLYLAMVTIGFERSINGIFQTVATKRRKGEPAVPRSRADLYGGSRA